LAIETNTKIGILSKALILCGEKPLESLSDNRYGATVGSNLFELLYENEIQSNPWRFATKKASLSQLNVTPVNQYQYVFQIPTDCLIPSHVYPRADYEIYGDRIYTNQSAVDLDYRFKPDVADIPAYFAMLMVYACAKDMIKPITESDQAMQLMERKYNRQRSVAMYADAQGRPAVPVQDNPFVDIR
jgi:hypothetical protein